jgi:taurine dioxygenase
MTVDTTPLKPSFKRLASTFGAELDLQRLGDVERTHFLNNVAKYLPEHKVLVIRNADLSHAQLVQLGRSMGTPLKYAFSGGVEFFPELIEIRRTPEQRTALSTMWHSDSTYLETPPDVTVLYGVEIPPFGGTTLFADTVAALDDLSPSMRDMLRTLRVVQRSDVHVNNERLAHVSKPATNAVALSAVHNAISQSDGAEAIYVSQEHSAYFEGMTRDESKPLMEFLMRHIIADKYRLEISWQPHTLVVSDNRKTQHRAIDNYYGHARTLLRLIVQLANRDTTNMESDSPLALAA